MTHSIRKYFMFFFGLVTAFAAHAQEGEEEFKHHRFTLVMANAHVPTGIGETGAKKWLVLSNWGLDYDYRFNDKWAVSIQTDLVIENFRVKAFESNPREFLDRSYPFSVAIAGIRELGTHLAVIAGTGIEFASEGNLYLIRGGFDYGWEINEQWGIGLTLLFDLKVDAYDSYAFGIGVNRRF